tara:strand:- start:147 stop:1418 length:1272 start_codon:yes stop_codon:yes gene_type:complete
MEELSDCTICLEKIKVTEIVTTRCGHWFCKDCFWKWTKQDNKCPNCREELIERDRSEELSMMRLLDRRREIVAENEILREEKKILTRRLRDQRKNIRRKRDILDELKDEILENEEIMDEIELWKRNPKLALKKMSERLEEIGKKKEKEQKYNMKFMLKQLQTRVGGGMSKRKICEWHYNRAYPGDNIHGAVLIYNWDYHGCPEKGWDFKDIISMMYPKKRMIKLKRRYMEAKEFYKRINEKYLWYNKVPLELDLWGNILKNDPADEMEEMPEEDIRDDFDEEMLPVTAYDEEEAELPSSSELVVTGEGIRGIPVLINASMGVITQQGEIPLEEFMRGDRSIPGLTVNDDGTMSYEGNFYEGRPVSEEEYNRLENGDIEDGITNSEMPAPVALGYGVDYSQYIDPEGEDYELGDNYELAQEELV